MLSSIKTPTNKLTNTHQISTITKKPRNRSDRGI